MTNTERYCFDDYTAPVWRRLLHALIPMVAALVSLTSCVDELELPDGGIPEGETSMMAEIRFTPLVTASLDGGKGRADDYDLSGTVAPTGSAMDELDNLWLLFYSQDGALVKTVDVDLTKYKPELEDRVDADAVNGIPAQEQTYCVKNLPLQLENGLYHMYAVANIENFTNRYSSEIQTIEGLRSIKLEWVRSNIARNKEMFGFFTNGKQTVYSDEYSFEDNPLVEVSPRMQTQGIHAWIRRAVSKLTIDFDGSGLRDNVFVYIKEARVYDIADGACLGHYSCVGDVPDREDNLPVRGGFGKVADGSAHVLMYGSDDQYENWPTVTNGQNFDSYRHKFPDGEQTIDLHDERAYCLPFYENMQGPGEMKYQDADGDGKIDNPLGGEHTGEGVNRVWLHEKAKDSKPNGTFVEVVGYYESRNNDNVTGGPIKYRFMLGKDVKNNFDCERNHHYKLTLAFKGNGNDVDWHIEYQEASGIHLPSPLYISYLYNKSMTFPIRINTGGRTVKSIKIDITKSNWAPYYDRSPGAENGGKLDIAYFEQADIDGGFGTKRPDLGFLSLIKTSKTRVTEEDIAGITLPANPTDLDRISAYYYKTYEDEGNLKIQRGSRTYLAEPGVHGTEENGRYTVVKDGDELELQIPLYTRAKQIFKESAYTGNNPYVGYPREAEITVTVSYDDNGKDDVRSTPVYQVRRLVNPKGIHRKAGNNKLFHVTLMELLKETSTTFTALQSIGPWKAYVLTGNGFITLDGGQEVSGPTLSEVDFNINFIGTCPEGENRYGVVEILYHNYSCVHQIFVSQGDAPVQLFSQKGDGDKSVYWHNRNMRLSNAEVDYEVDEGSLFRLNRWDFPIDACNNWYTNPDPWVNIKASDFSISNDKAGGNYRMAYDLSVTKTWAEIGSGSDAASFPTQTDAAGNKYMLPTTREFQYLRDATEQAYGVLYGNDAEEVQTELDKAYGYQRNEKGEADEDMGMRGCFAYVGANGESAFYGRHIFFPVGASGYGRRKHGGYRAAWKGDKETYDGIMRYASGRTQEYKPTNTLLLPLFFDLYKRPGAIYWARQSQEFTPIGGGKETYGIALDVNYFTFDFNLIDTGNLFGRGNLAGDDDNNANRYNHSDAAFIRCVTRK